MGAFPLGSDFLRWRSSWASAWTLWVTGWENPQVAPHQTYRLGPRPLNPGVLPKVGASGLGMGHHVAWGCRSHPSLSEWLWVGRQLHLRIVLFSGLGTLPLTPGIQVLFLRSQVRTPSAFSFGV